MEIMTGLVLSVLLPKLDTLLTDKYNLQKGLRGEIMFLRAELESMQAALERVSAAAPPIVDKQIKIWTSNVRELSYDVEDSIDEFMIRVDTHDLSKPRGFGGFIDRSLSLLTTARVRHRIAVDIKGIRSLVQEVSERRDRYKVDNIIADTTIDPRLHGIYEESTKLVAVSGPREELARLLEQDDGPIHQLKVISIVGVGGLGKTTLANVVYQQIKMQFDCAAFVTVSLEPDLKRVLSSLLRQVSKQSYGDIETWDVVELIDRIRQVLQDKRCQDVEKTSDQHSVCTLNFYYICP